MNQKEIDLKGNIPEHCRMQAYREIRIGEASHPRPDVMPFTAVEGLALMCAQCGKMSYRGL